MEDRTGAWFGRPVAGVVGSISRSRRGDHGLADGPTEVHKMTVARQLLRDYQPSDGLWPTERIPGKLDAAKAKFA